MANGKTKWQKVEAMDGSGMSLHLQAQAARCSDRHRSRRQHHRRPRGEPLEVTMKIWQQPLLNCVPLSCAAAVDLTALNCASIETTAPNFSASKRMSVQISAYLHRNMQKLPMVFSSKLILDASRLTS
jgi:hypothetical protein